MGNRTSSNILQLVNVSHSPPSTFFFPLYSLAAKKKRRREASFYFFSLLECTIACDIDEYIMI
jgi:hypothetical protein